MSAKSSPSPKPFDKPTKKDIAARKEMSPASLQALLPTFAAELDLDKQAAKMAVCRLWQQILPDAFKNTAKATGLAVDHTTNQTTLLVSVFHGGVASELQLMGPALCEELNRYASETGVTLAGIKVSVKR